MDPNQDVSFDALCGNVNFIDSDRVIIWYEHSQSFGDLDKKKRQRVAIVLSNIFLFVEKFTTHLFISSYLTNFRFR